MTSHSLLTKIYICFLFFISGTSVFANDFELALIPNGSSTPGGSISIAISATSLGSSHDITGAVFTAIYDPTVFTFTGFSNPFFDSFTTQGFVPSSVEVNGTTYSEPIVVSVSEGLIKIAASMANPKTIAAGASVELFNLHFSVDSNTNPDSYQFLLVQTVASNIDAGYSSSGESVPLLIGPGSEPTLPGAYTVFGVNSTDSYVVINPPPDADGDGLSDQLEISIGSDPDNPDTDGDEMSDYYEHYNDLNLNANDAAADLDNDGLTNIEEYNLGLKANNPDCDGDGLLDGEDEKPLLNLAAIMVIINSIILQ